jgi:hypothetical protein
MAILCARPAKCPPNAVKGHPKMFSCKEKEQPDKMSRHFASAMRKNVVLSHMRYREGIGLDA